MAVVWALIDSVDPCIFALLASILASSILVDAKLALKVGFSFIAGVYAGYVVFGVLIRYATLRLPLELLATIVITYGLCMLVATFVSAKRSDLVCKEDDVACAIASKLKLAKIARGPLTSGLLGVISAFTLLPCSAGLFVLYNITTRSYSYLLWIPLTLLYVGVFILPLAAIVLSFVGLYHTRPLYQFLVSHEKQVKIAGAIIMMSTGLYMLASSILI